MQSTTALPSAPGAAVRQGRLSRLAARWVAPWLATTALVTGLVASPAPAWAQVGLQSWTMDLPSSRGTAERAPVLLWYPTAEASRAQRLGPFVVNAAFGAVPAPGRRPLVLVSHGTGGSELGHAWLAEHLVQAGYLVLTLRHPGDNYEDRSAIARTDYFAERPRQLSRALDRLLADPRWAARIDPQRIAALGHSAGGHTVLALAGLPVQREQVLTHCGPQGEGWRLDAVFCGLGGWTPEHPAPAASGPAQPAQDLRDARLRAVVADAPLAIALQLNSAEAARAALRMPTLLRYSQREEVLAPRVHGQALCTALAASPQVRCEVDTQAGHMALFQAGTGPLGGPKGADPTFDPPGFDRAAWQQRSAVAITQFLAQAMRAAGSAR